MHSGKVIVSQRIRNFSQTWGKAIIRDAAIKREITVVTGSIYGVYTP